LVERGPLQLHRLGGRYDAKQHLIAPLRIWAGASGVAANRMASAPPGGQHVAGDLGCLACVSGSRMDADSFPGWSQPVRESRQEEEVDGQFDRRLGGKLDDSALSAGKT